MFAAKKMRLYGAITGALLIGVSILMPVIGKATEPSSSESDLLQGAVSFTNVTEDTQSSAVSGPTCTNMTVQVAHAVFNTLVGSPEEHCMISTTSGLIDKNSSLIQPLGFAKAYPLNINRGGQPVLVPVPNSAAALLLTNDTNYPGLNIGIYDNLFSHLVFSNNTFDMKFTLRDEPTTFLKYPSGRSLAANASTLNFSNDGRYMIIDGVFQGFIRIDLLTHQSVTFAEDLLRINDFGLVPATTSISASGRYAVIAYNAPGGWGSKFFKIIDIDTCGSATAAFNSATTTCKSRDMYAAANSAISGLAYIDSLAFTSENSLLMTARYAFDGKQYKEGQFTVAPAGQTASRKEYLAMGDSYISGEGAGSYLLGTDTSDNKCHQSLVSYPYLLGKNLNSVASVACSAATVDNVISNDSNHNDFQLYASVKPNDAKIDAAKSYHLPGYIAQKTFLGLDNPQMVTISIGGNDVGFEDIIKKCTVLFNNFSSLKQNCYQTYEERLALVNQINGQFNNLYQTYIQLKENAPTRRVYVVGYPQIVNPDGACAVNVHLSKSDAQFAQQLIAYLDSVIAKAASKAGVTYVDTQHVFDGHRLCDSGRKAVNGLTKGNDKLLVIANESYHPNAYGHELFASAIARATNNLAKPMPAPQNIANPIADSNLPILNVPHSGGQVYNIANVNTDTSELLFRGGVYTVPGSSSAANLAPNASWSVVLYSTPTQLGTIYSDGSGILTGSVHVPADTPPGFHTLHYYGTNIAGEPVDIQDVIYVAASPDDYDGDGVTNDNDSCPTVPQSGEDVDKDGVDDACSGDIGPAPITLSQTSETPTTNTEAAVETTGAQQPAFMFTLTNAKKLPPVINQKNLTNNNEVALTNAQNGTPRVLHAQTFATAKSLPIVAGKADIKFSNAKLIAVSFASIGLIAAVCFGLVRLRDR